MDRRPLERTRRADRASATSSVEEFSRDIEPMKGGHGDNYYWQLVANVRRFKGVAALAKASAAKPIRIDGGFEQWRDVGPEFLDHVGETIPRDFDGAAGAALRQPHRPQRPGRDEGGTRCRKRLLLRPHARADHACRSDPNWMWLLDRRRPRTPRTGWEGYDFIVEPHLDAGRTTWLEKNVGGWNWEKVAKASYRDRRQSNCTWRFHVRRCGLPTTAPRFRSTSNGPTTSRNPAT